MEKSIKLAQEIFNNDYKKLYNDLGLNINDGTKILELLLTQYDPKKIYELSEKIKLLELNDIKKNVFVVIIALLGKLNNAITYLPKDENINFLDKNSKEFLPFHEVIYDLSIMIKLLSRDLPEKSSEHIGIFFTLLNIMSLSKIVKIEHLIEFLSIICKDNNYVLDEILEGFFESYSFFSKMLEDNLHKCTNCKKCSEDNKIDVNYH